MAVIGSKDNVEYLPGSGVFIAASEFRAFAYDDLNQVIRRTPGVYLRQEDGHGLFPNVSGAASLGGTLQVSHNNGFESSVDSDDTFTVLTASSLSNLFSNVTPGQRLITLDGFGSFQINYGEGSTFAANSLVLSNFEAIPEPSTWLMLGFGGVLLAILRYRRRFYTQRHWNLHTLEGPALSGPLGRHGGRPSKNGADL